VSSRTKALATGLTVLIVTAVFGYWAYNSNKKRDLRAAVIVILHDVSPRIREALTLEVSLPPTGRVGTGAQLEQHVAAVDRRLQQLKRLNGTPDFQLFDAADSYVVTVREILRQQAASNRHRLSLSESLEALRSHMQADDRTGAWVQEAVTAKEQVDKNYREYRVSTEAFSTILGTLTPAQAKIALYVDASTLSDVQLISETRQRTFDATNLAAAEIEKIKELAAQQR
jgi:hypothetical protein